MKRVAKRRLSYSAFPAAVAGLPTDIHPFPPAQTATAPMQASDFFFIVGCPRSGTTLLSVLLDRHSGLCVPPETAFYDEIAPRLPAPPAELAGLLGAWYRLGELGLTPTEVLAELAGQTASPAGVLAALLRLYARKNGKRRCGEKTPQHLRHIPAILDGFPAARIVCLLRDGRDVALSLQAMPWWRHSLVEAAAMWRDSVRLMEDCLDRYPGRMHVVRYEELVSRPQAALPELMAYLGERYEPGQTDAGIASATVLQRSRAWKGQALAAPDPGAIGRRRAMATAAEIDLLELDLREELRRCGYR